MTQLSLLQQEVARWSSKNFPNKKPYQPLLGICEEAGELAHAHLKLEQGIRGSEVEHHAAKVDAVGDIIIYLADYCEQNGINLSLAVETVWNSVRNRDWQKNKSDGKV